MRSLHALVTTIIDWICLGNQFRALEEDEVLFLDSILEKQREEERLRLELEGEELKNFRQCVAHRLLYSRPFFMQHHRAVAARENASKPPPIPAELSPPATTKPKGSASAPPVKKDSKKSLKGVIVKKKTKPIATSSSVASVQGDTKTKSPAKDQDDEQPAPKRRKTQAGS